MNMITYGVSIGRYLGDYFYSASGNPYNICLADKMPAIVAQSYADIYNARNAISLVQEPIYAAAVFCFVDSEE